MGNLDLQATIPVLERSLAVFRPHHQELRQRTVKILLTIVACSGVAYAFAEEIAQFFIRPLFAASPLVYKMVYTNLPEAFLAYLKLALLLGLIASGPVVLYQSWRFVAPGLRDNEKRFAVTVVFWGSLLFAGGAAFSYWVLLPQMLGYFMSYAHEGLAPLPKLGLYLTFVGRMILAAGLAFQIPFLMVMAGKAGLVPSGYFGRNRMYFYIAIIILAFLLAAGDFMATALLALPLFLLYEAGLLLTKIFHSNKTASSS